jgi:hypothetical protein
MAMTDRVLPGLEDGPWRSLADAGVYQAGKLRVARNVYPMDPAIGERYVGRPGWYQLGATLAGRLQGFLQFKGAGIGELSIAIAAGNLYRMLPGSGVWTLAVTPANIVTAGGLLSTTTPTIAALLVFSGGFPYLMLSDGVNQPILWSGGLGAAAITPMPNCPVLYGPPTMYEGRVFGIKAADRLTMVWSEADSPLTGYEAGGFTNAWSVRQTDNRDLSALAGTNAGLLIARERSATHAVGAVGPDFASEATREGVSETIGVMHPYAVVRAPNGILMLDALARPQFYQQGAQGFTPVWHDLSAAVALAARNVNFAAALGVAFPPLGMACFLMPGTELSTALDTLWLYDVSGPVPVPVAVWDADSGNGLTCALGTVTLFSASRGYVTTLLIGDTAGHVYALSDPLAGTVWNDQWATGTVPIAHAIETGELGYATKREKVFDRVDIAGEAPTAQTLTVAVTTPNGQTADQTATLGLTALDTHADVGIDAYGRWARVRIEHEVLNEQFGLAAVAVTGYGSSADPEVK